jgi:hypothetical protein
MKGDSGPHAWVAFLQKKASRKREAFIFAVDGNLATFEKIASLDCPKLSPDANTRKTRKRAEFQSNLGAEKDRPR